MIWDINPVRTDAHRQDTVQKVLSWYRGVKPGEAANQVPSQAGFEMSPVLAVSVESLDKTMAAITMKESDFMMKSCDHDPIDNGFSFAYCRKCDAKMRMIDFKWTAV